MSDTSINQMTRSAIEAGEGILRLAPNWVPRVFSASLAGVCGLHPRTITPWGPTGGHRRALVCFHH